MNNCITGKWLATLRAPLNISAAQPTIPKAPPEKPYNPSPRPEDEPIKPVPEELPPAQAPMPEIEPYQMPPVVDPNIPQPRA